MDLKIGEGKFKIVKKLGSGAFGEIYKGLNQKTGEDVAIKMVKRSLLKPIKESYKTKFPYLLYEAKLYKLFQGGGKLYDI